MIKKGPWIVAFTFGLAASGSWASEVAVDEVARDEARKAQATSNNLAGGLVGVSDRVDALEQDIVLLESRLGDLEAQPDQDTLGGLNCATGQVAKWSGADWACGDDNDTIPPDSDTLADLQCQVDEVAAYDGAAWVCRSLPSPPEPTGKVVFATSLAFQGESIGGVSGADRVCTVLASEAGLPGQFRAWLSDSIATSPVGRFVPSNAPYVRTDGAIVANDWEDLTRCDKGDSGNECLRAPINIDQQGAPVTHHRIWTGTFSNGTLAQTFGSPKRRATCNDWQDDPDVANANDGVAGRPNEVDQDWTERPSAGLICQDPGIFGGLYCFEQ